jgi:hypothetical protein
MSKVSHEFYMSKLNFAHFYFHNTKLGNLSLLVKNFQNSYSFDIETLPSKLPEIDILFIEIDELSKEKFKKIHALVKRFSTHHVNLFYSKPESSFLLKFALHFGVFRIIDINNDKDFLEKTLYEAVLKCYEKYLEKQQIEIAKKINGAFASCVLKNGKIIYANETTLTFLDAKNNSDLLIKLQNNTQIKDMLKNSKEQYKSIVLEQQGEEWKCYASIENLEFQERLFILFPYVKVKDEDCQWDILNRFRFIELLKDKLVQNSLAKKDMSLMLINISNYEKATKAVGSIKVHDFVKQFINKLLKYKGEYEELTQWNPHFFIIFIEDEHFEKVKERLDTLHQKLLYSDAENEINPIITSSILRLKNDDINQIILHVENISSGEITYEEFEQNEYFEINHLNDYLSEEEQINHYLHNCIANKTSLKLLNIYKGLCINTHSKVLKFSEDSYLFSFETLQGYSMEVEGKTVIQSPDLPSDMSANVSYVNFEKSYAVLDCFSFLQTSANSRQHTRVQPASRTPLSLSFEKYAYQGEILDISINSIAVKFNQRVNKKLLNQLVSMDFKLPSAENEFGYVQMKIKGFITHIADYDKIYCKVVFLLQNLQKPYDSYLLKYMYTRQKHLIFELKKLARVNSLGRK